MIILEHGAGRSGGHAERRRRVGHLDTMLGRRPTAAGPKRWRGGLERSTFMAGRPLQGGELRVGQVAR